MTTISTQSIRGPNSAGMVNFSENTVGLNENKSSPPFSFKTKNSSTHSIAAWNDLSNKYNNQVYEENIAHADPLQIKTIRNPDKESFNTKCAFEKCKTCSNNSSDNIDKSSNKEIIVSVILLIITFFAIGILLCLYFRKRNNTLSGGSFDDNDDDNKEIEARNIIEIIEDDEDLII